LPDLTAVFDVRGISGSERLLRKIASATALNPEHRVATCSADTFVAANVLKSFSFALEQPYFQDEDCLFVDGAVYDDRSMGDLLGVFLSRNCQALRTLNGQFNVVIFNSSQNELTVITDRLGTRPIYHAVAGTRHVISSEIKGVRAGLDRRFEIHSEGLLELFAFGHNIDSKTVLDGVRVLPPGAVITIDADGMRHRSYYEFGYTAASSVVSPREWGEQIASCIKSIIPRYLKSASRTGIFLSGGLDSRIIAGAIGQSGASLSAYTFGELESRDVLFGSEIACRLAFPHDVFAFPPNYLSGTIGDVVGRSECAAPFYHASSMLFHDSIARNTDSLLVGWCGDNLSGGHLTRPILTSSNRAEVAEQIFKRALCAGSGNLARVFQPSFFSQHWPEMKEAFTASVNAIKEAEGADIADVWDMRHRQRRFTFSASKVDRGRFEVVAPLLDVDFVRLMTSLPLQARWKQAAYRWAIVDGFPELRTIPWARTGRPVRGGKAVFWMDEGRRVGSKLFELTLRKFGIAGAFSGERYRDIAEDIRLDQRLFTGYLEPLLSNGSLPAEIFDLDGIRELAHEHMKGSDHSHLLGTILTVGVYFDSWRLPEGSPLNRAI
jgi:asparagine synthetase B (glutamine-hydrolysing)